MATQPPYPANSLSYPLTRGQYADIIAYMFAVDPAGTISIAATQTTFPFGNHAAENTLISNYNWYVTHNGQAAPVPSGNGPTVPGVNTLGGQNVLSVPGEITSVTDFLSKLWAALSNPARLAEFAVGSVLVIVGLNAVLRDPIGKTTKQAARYGKYVAL